MLEELGQKLKPIVGLEQFGNPYTNTQLSTKAFDTVPADIFVTRMVLTKLKIRSVITNRNLYCACWWVTKQGCQLSRAPFALLLETIACPCYFFGSFPCCWHSGHSFMQLHKNLLTCLARETFVDRTSPGGVHPGVLEFWRDGSNAVYVERETKALPLS